MPDPSILGVATVLNPNNLGLATSVMIEKISRRGMGMYAYTHTHTYTHIWSVCH